jgi:uncharacterized protein
VLSDDDGRRAVHLARAALVAAVGDPSGSATASPEESSLPPVFDEPRGAFVTLKENPGGELRGCIGYPLPVLPLKRAIEGAAVSAGTEDPRFLPVRPGELDRVTVEVSVLTVPVLVPGSRPEEIVRGVRVGRDGLIVDGHGTSGLLLPQVAPEQGWSAEELLNGTCEKAGLPLGAWRDPTRVRVRRFEAEVFGEERPGGPVRRTPR